MSTPRLFESIQLRKGALTLFYLFTEHNEFLLISLWRHWNNEFKDDASCVGFCFCGSRRRSEPLALSVHSVVRRKREREEKPSLKLISSKTLAIFCFVFAQSDHTYVPPQRQVLTLFSSAVQDHRFCLLFRFDFHRISFIFEGFFLILSIC